MGCSLFQPMLSFLWEYGNCDLMHEAGRSPSTSLTVSRMLQTTFKRRFFLFFICCNLTGNMCSFSELFVWLRLPNPSISLYGIIAQRKTFSELLITILILSGVSWPHSLANPSQLLNWSTNYIRDLRLSHLLCEPVRACVQAKNVRPYGSEAWYALQDRKYHGLLLI